MTKFWVVDRWSAVPRITKLLWKLQDPKFDRRQAGNGRPDDRRRRWEEARQRVHRDQAVQGGVCRVKALWASCVRIIDPINKEQTSASSSSIWTRRRSAFAWRASRRALTASSTCSSSGPKRHLYISGDEQNWLFPAPGDAYGHRVEHTVWPRSHVLSLVQLSDQVGGDLCEYYSNLETARHKYIS